MEPAEKVKIEKRDSAPTRFEPSPIPDLYSVHKSLICGLSRAFGAILKNGFRESRSMDIKFPGIKRITWERIFVFMHAPAFSMDYEGPNIDIDDKQTAIDIAI